MQVVIKNVFPIGLAVWHLLDTNQQTYKSNLYVELEIWDALRIIFGASFSGEIQFYNGNIKKNSSCNFMVNFLNILRKFESTFVLFIWIKSFKIVKNTKRVVSDVDN